MCKRWIETNVRMGKQESTASNAHYMAGRQTQADRGATCGEYSRTARSIPLRRARTRWVQLVRVRTTTTTDHIRRQRLEYGCCWPNERAGGSTVRKNKNQAVGLAFAADPQQALAVAVDLIDQRQVALPAAARELVDADGVDVREVAVREAPVDCHAHGPIDGVPGRGKRRGDLLPRQTLGPPSEEPGVAAGWKKSGPDSTDRGTFSTLPAWRWARDQRRGRRCRCGCTARICRRATGIRSSSG